MPGWDPQADAMQQDWDSNPRWQGVLRKHCPDQVLRLRAARLQQPALAGPDADTLWRLLSQDGYVNALGAASGEHALQQARAGLKALVLELADPGQSAPLLARQLHRAFHGQADRLPIVAGADAGFGGQLDIGARVQALIEAGVAGVHVDDQLLPLEAAIDRLGAARLAADVMGAATVLIARTDARQAGPGQALARALAYAPYADLLWCETGRPDLFFARQFAEAVHAAFPGKMLAYHCSPAFDWKLQLDDGSIARFQKELGAMGYQFQFTTLAGQHPANMFTLAQGYARRQMSAFVEFFDQQKVA